MGARRLLTGFSSHSRVISVFALVWISVMNVLTPAGRPGTWTRRAHGFERLLARGRIPRHHRVVVAVGVDCDQVIVHGS